MARDPESELPLNSHRGDSNTVHRVDVEPAGNSSSANTVVQREVKYFKKWVSWLVPAVVVANVVVFIITMYVNDCPKNSDSCVAKFLGRFSFQPTKENPLLGPSALTLDKMGALNMTKVVNEEQGWRLVTSMWLHGGVVHVLANMLSLFFIGIPLEQEFGFVRIGLLYLISGLGGSVLSGLFIESNISVGASGALCGLLGGMLSELITNWTTYAHRVAALLMLIIISAATFAMGLLPRVDNFAHIGGFVSGLLLGFVLLVKPQYKWVRQRYASSGHPSASSRSKYNICQCILWVVSLILLVAGFTIGFILLYRGVNANDHCSWCHYLTCIPTKRWSCDTNPAYCEISQIGSQFNLTCNGKSATYMMQRPSQSQIQGLCDQLCR